MSALRRLLPDGLASRSAATGGAGLSPSIARSIIAAHGGTIRLETGDAGGLRPCPVAAEAEGIPGCG